MELSSSSGALLLSGLCFAAPKFRLRLGGDGKHSTPSLWHTYVHYVSLAFEPSAKFYYIESTLKFGFVIWRLNIHCVLRAETKLLPYIGDFVKLDFVTSRFTYTHLVHEYHFFESELNTNTFAVNQIKMNERTKLSTNHILHDYSLLVGIFVQNKYPCEAANS